MTLVLSVNGAGAIGVMADRRLTFNDQPPHDGATKIMALGAQDGSAFIGYARLGITARGTEPADWMANCLLDANAPLEECLDVSAECANRERPRHLVTLPPTGRDMEIERCYGR